MNSENKTKQNMDIIVREFDEDGQHRDKTYQYHEIEDGSIVKQSNCKTNENSEIFFVTGNKNKVIELQQNIKLERVKFSILNIDLAEIQDSDILNIVQDKCERAFERINKLDQDGQVIGRGVQFRKENTEQNNRLVLVEDTSLNFKALNGMPGPYVKWFMKGIGPDGLHRMLAGFEDKSAEAVCIYALMESKKRILFFRGTVHGRITKPRGSSWGWDPIFEEERSSLTFGEMEASMKSKFSHRGNALTILKKYLTVLEG